MDQIHSKAQTKLTKTDLSAIDLRTQAEVEALLGQPPTLDDIQGDAHGAQWLTPVLRFVNAAALAVTLFMVELVQAAGAIVLLIAFGILEIERIFSGASTLGLDHTQASIAAVAVVAGNIVLPIYRYRNVRGKATVTRTRQTVRGWLVAFWRRLTARPQSYEAAASKNPTLHTFEGAATWAALAFALLAVLGNMLALHGGGRGWLANYVATFTESTGKEMLEFVGGFLLSVVGVMGLQSVSHELAVRAHEERPEDAREVLKARQAEYRAQTAAIREQVTQDHMAAKLADKARRDAAKRGDIDVPVRSNGHGF